VESKNGALGFSLVETRTPLERDGFGSKHLESEQRLLAPNTWSRLPALLHIRGQVFSAETMALASRLSIQDRLRLAQFMVDLMEN